MSLKDGLRVCDGCGKTTGASGVLLQGWQTLQTDLTSIDWVHACPSCMAPVHAKIAERKAERKRVEELRRNLPKLPEDRRYVLAKDGFPDRRCPKRGELYWSERHQGVRRALFDFTTDEHFIVEPIPEPPPPAKGWTCISCGWLKTCQREGIKAGCTNNSLWVAISPPDPKPEPATADDDDYENTLRLEVHRLNQEIAELKARIGHTEVRWRADNAINQEVHESLSRTIGEVSAERDRLKAELAKAQADPLLEGAVNICRIVGPPIGGSETAKAAMQIVADYDARQQEARNAKP